ncbi:hypothetical protein [Kaarinaea lacus]
MKNESTNVQDSRHRYIKYIIRLMTHDVNRHSQSRFGVCQTLLIAADDNDPIDFPVIGFELGIISRRAVQFG